MKKRLNIDSITNELEGASAYFTRPTPPPAAQPEKANVVTREPSPSKPKQASARQYADRRQPEKATPVPSEQPTSTQASMKASTLASYPDSIIETIRKAVKQTGREVTFVRLTPE